MEGCLEGGGRGGGWKGISELVDLDLVRSFKFHDMILCFMVLRIFIKCTLYLHLGVGWFSCDLGENLYILRLFTYLHVHAIWLFQG
jgi:hypothetical protein